MAIARAAAASSRGRTEENSWASKVCSMMYFARLWSFDVTFPALLNRRKK